jgi:hypothetical protein
LVLVAVTQHEQPMRADAVLIWVQFPLIRQKRSQIDHLATCC